MPIERSNRAGRLTFSRFLLLPARLLGTTYGGDGGFSGFAVPDLRGRVMLGDDNTSAFAIGKVMGSNDLVFCCS